MSVARAQVTDERYAQWLANRGHRNGDLLRTLAELKKHPRFDKARWKEFLEHHSEEEIALRLQLVNDLDTCFKSARIPPGGAASVAFWFDHKAASNTIVAKEPVVEASTIPPEYQQAFDVCLAQAFQGKSFPGEVDDGHSVWPSTVPVPASDHEMLNWLLPEESH